MRLNHVNLAVTDVDAAERFLMKYFAMRPHAGDGQTGAAKKFTVLFDDGGLVLILMKAGKQIKYPGSFHIGFVQPDEAAVNDLYARMTADGYQMAPPQRAHAWTFYVNAPGGFMVEVLA